MIHNPLLKAHFLSDMVSFRFLTRQHSRSTCIKSGPCMACKLDELYSAFYSSDTTSFAPHSILYTMWISQTHMAGYSQQDAHEFFISFLDEIHKCCSRNSTGSNGVHHHTTPCSCVVHQVFGGVLQSEVTCTTCHNVSLTFDPILDISLEIKNSSRKKKDNAQVSLTDCLEDYTIPEKLNSYSCKVCNVAGEATKQLSFQALPPVLSIQLKVQSFIQYVAI